MSWFLLLGIGILGVAISLIFFGVTDRGEMVNDTAVGIIAIMFFGLFFVVCGGLIGYSILFGLTDMISAIM